MIKLEKICAGYNKKIFLKNITTDFKEGKIYVILGPNGSGKSTLLKIIDYILKPIKGTVFLGKEELKNYTKRALARKIAYLPQKNKDCPFFSVFDTILLGRKPHINFEPRKKDLKIVENLITSLNLTPLTFKKIEQLSGGEFQKVLIARALAQEPKILLLDEPINHLDPKNQIELLTILRERTKQLNITTLIVLHDINLALQVADYFILMKNGKIRFKGDHSIINSATLKEIFNIDTEIITFNNSQKIVVLKL